MQTLVHINQPQLRANAKEGTRYPVITVKTYRSNRYGHRVELLDSRGKRVGRVVYAPDSEGEKVWVEALYGVRRLDAADAPVDVLYGLTRLHVDRLVIRNSGGEKRAPAIRQMDGTQQAMYGAQILDARGEVACTFVYRPDKPLSCGAKLWISTKNAVQVLDALGNEVFYRAVSDVCAVAA